MVTNHSGTSKAREGLFTTFFNLFDFVGSARRHNDRINDEMETLKFEVEVLRRANKHLRAENAKLRTYQDNLIEQIGKVSIRCEWLEDANEKYGRDIASAQPLIAYALKRKASLAAYELKRGGAK